MNGGISFTLALALILHGACCLFLYVTQRGFIYFPTAESGERRNVWGTLDQIIYLG